MIRRRPGLQEPTSGSVVNRGNRYGMQEVEVVMSERLDTPYIECGRNQGASYVGARQPRARHPGAN